MSQNAPGDRQQHGPQAVSSTKSGVVSSHHHQDPRMRDSQGAPGGMSSDSQFRPAPPARTNTNPLPCLPGQYPASGPPPPPPHGPQPQVSQSHGPQPHSLQIQGLQSHVSQSQGPQSHSSTVHGPSPQGHSAHGHPSHGPGPQGPARRASIGYTNQEAAPRDGYKVLARTYDKTPRDHYDPMAYGKDYGSDSYGSDNRDRYDRRSGKEVNNSVVYDPSADLRNGLDKLKKKFKQHDDNHDTWASSSRKTKHSSHSSHISGLEQLKKERDYYRAEHEKLLHRTGFLQDQIRELDDALAVERANVERARRSANTMQSTMDTRESFLGAQENDDTIEAEFVNLMSEVKNWSGRFSSSSNSGGGAERGGGQQQQHTLDPSRLQDYQKVFPQCADLEALSNAVRPARKPRLFVRGWTAYVMCVRLLRGLDLPPGGNSGEDVWLGGMVAQSFHHLENRMWFGDRNLISYKSFNDWRAFTAELLGKIASFPPSHPTDEALSLITAAVKDVMHVACAWQKNPSDQPATEAALSIIFQRAVQFSRLLRRQRALWSVRFPLAADGGGGATASVTATAMSGSGSGSGLGLLRFDPGCMKNYRVEDEDEEVGGGRAEQRFVEIVVTPALFKRGTMDGEKFDREEAMRVAEVGLA